MIKSLCLDARIVVDRDSTEWEYAVYKVGPIFLITNRCDYTDGWDAYDNLEEVKQVWMDICDLSPEELIF